MCKELHIEALFFIMKGKILVSSPSLLSDTIFNKSVILIVDKRRDGITGFILNKIGGFLFTKNKNNSSSRKYEFGFGGPVSNETFYLLKSEKIHEESIKIDHNYYWGNDVQLIINQIENGKINKENVIFFQGYSGWDEQQLDYEIENKSWIIIDKFDRDIFRFKEKNCWNQIISEIGDKYKIWSNSPEDISLN